MNKRATSRTGKLPGLMVVSDKIWRSALSKRPDFYIFDIYSVVNVSQESWNKIPLQKPSCLGLNYQEIVDNLQEQLSICLREKDHVDNLLQDALGECDRLRAVSERGLQPLVDNLEQQCSRKIESYGRSIAALNTEVARSKLHLDEKQQQV